MPPIRQHQQLSNVEATENIPPNTRASRVGVTNFINVIKNLHPGESRNHFPITQETLQEYIDSKRKALIKAGSLEQYLQHIQAYNIALGFGWQGQVFGPIIKKALDELRDHEEEIQIIYHHNHLHQPQITFAPIEFNTTVTTANTTTPAADVINMLVGMDVDVADVINMLVGMDVDNSNNNVARQNNEQSKTIPVVCFDTTSNPYVMMSQQVNVSLSNLNFTDSFQNLRQLYVNIASLNLPSQWDAVDISHLHYRIGILNNSEHFRITDESEFARFWETFTGDINKRDKQVQLVVYRKTRRLHHAANCFDNNKCQPQTPESSASASSPRLIGSTSETILKSVTIRSKSKIYKQNIAMGENTTFASLITFATNKAIPPVGKQFVIRSIDETFEYIPDDLVKEVITGIEHAELLVTLEEVGPIDFDYF
ncbi:10953_t:CDS:2 [Ambispora gerdemannii]|uniref:10953_t:CDS:1 n=1 Tax=Ambispora gerdemannii TaxID=144530 RepID=A0A9N8Z397_9GLOM|nr:10953_t:CDS:2 [Ambispora gerdemannii]